jgi:hypothetical protein
VVPCSVVGTEPVRRSGSQVLRTETRQIGHVHDDGHADFRFPREVRDELIRTGRAIPHPAFPDSRTTVSYRIQGEEDVAGALELFRMNYERRKQRSGPAKPG